MEFLMAAAVAGAGYVAKYCQQLNSKGSEDSSDSVQGDLVLGQSDSRKLFHQFKDRALPLPRLGQKQFGREDDWDGYFPETNRSGFGDNETGVASTSGAVIDGNNVLSLMNLSNFQETGYGEKGKSEFAAGEMGTIRIRHRNIRNRSLGYYVKPMNSLESCLTAQLYKDHDRIEQYVYSSVPSSAISTVRPLLVTNGRQIISRASSEVRRDSGLGEREIRSRMGSIELPRRSKVSFAKQRRSSRLSISSTRPPEGPYHSQGSLNGMLLFFLGITIGIMSTVVANQRETDKLNERLEQSEKLVQDLHEELEMKDFSTIKELTGEDFQSPTTNKHLDEQGMVAKPIDYDDKETGENGAEKAELMNKIEAELEAELEKLELSMNASRLERISKLVELDPSFVADVVLGELEIDNDSEHNASGTSTTDIHPSNYAVPPMELSLRLHEVIKSRLEARIMELEAALESSPQRRQSMELGQTISSRMLYSESESLSTQESPICRDEGSESDQPVVMNLSGEALDAYNETYDEMYRMDDTDEETDHPVNKTTSQSRNDHENDVFQYGNIEEGEEEVDDDDDEIEKLLIKQIVERNKKGSPVVLNVKQMLYSMNDQ